MNRERADRIVAVVVGAVLVLGGALGWQAYQQNRALEESMGSMMGTSMGAAHGTDPFWYVLGTLLTSAVVVGLYLTVRGDLPVASVSEDERDRVDEPGRGDEPDIEGPASDPAATEPRNPEATPLERVLDLLPDDERRILEPVLTSPGITQIELRDRSDFSKSKVSQTVSELEKRGLLYRERQGRTYRIYPSDELRRDRD